MHHVKKVARMFSGIVEAKARLLEYSADRPQNPDLVRIKVEKPKQFNDIALGDSISVNGICLTVEAQSEKDLQFAMARETLEVTGFNQVELQKRPLNLERSMKLNDRIHGHIVTGHVDGMGVISAIKEMNQSRNLTVQVPAALLPLVWKKGSVCLNGVSLTVNEVTDQSLEVCLIPETLNRTNLADVSVGDKITIEIDQMARGISRLLKFKNPKDNQ
jgi:riboflavin synthase